MKEEIYIVYVFGGDHEWLLGVFDELNLAEEGMKKNLTTWCDSDDMKLGPPQDGNGRTIYPVIIDGQKCSSGACFSYMKTKINYVRKHDSGWIDFICR